MTHLVNQNENDDKVNISYLLETVSGQLINFNNPESSSILMDDIAWALSRIPRFAGHTITKIPYNVAQHSIYVSNLVKQILINDTDHPLIKKSLTNLINFKVPSLLIELMALLHDCAEAYIGDIPSPLKRHPLLYNVIKNIESKFLSVINDTHGAFIFDSNIFVGNYLIYIEYEKEHSHDENIFSYGPIHVMDDIGIVVNYADKLAQRIEGYQFMMSRGQKWNLPQASIVQLQNFPQPLPAINSYKAFKDHYTKLINLIKEI